MTECRYTYEEQDDPLQQGYKVYPVTDQATRGVVCILSDCTPQAAALVAERLNAAAEIDQIRSVVESLLPYAEADAQDRARLGDETAQDAFTAIAEARRLVDDPDAPSRDTSSGAPYHRTVLRVEVISDEATDFQDLAEVEYAITHGGCSGMWQVIESGRLTREQARRALEAQGTDPAFLLGEDEELGPDRPACTGCGYQDDPSDAGSSMCGDCGDCEDCCCENHGGEPHGRGA